MRVAIIFLVLGVLFFMVGMHGIDNAWNLPDGWNDSNYFGDLFSKVQLYNQSLMLAFSGFMVSVFSALYIGINYNKVTKPRKSDVENIFYD